jgi:hypothetical protein
MWGRGGDKCMTAKQTKVDEPRIIRELEAPHTILGALQNYLFLAHLALSICSPHAA